MKKKKVIRKGNEIIIPSCLDYLPCVDEFLEKKLRKLKVDKNSLVDCAISLSEVVINAIQHGNCCDLEKKVKVELITGPEKITLRVTDEGKGFDPKSLKDPVDQDSLLKKAGRGLFIVKNLMDELSFSFDPGQGSCVEMVKKLKRGL